jgi:hypothetical protein
MLAYEGTKKVIRVDMPRPPAAPKEEMHPELAAAIRIAGELDIAEKALEQGNIEGAIDVLKRLKDAGKKAIKGVKDKLKKAPCTTTHVAVELPKTFLDQMERMLGFFAKLNELLLRVVPDKGQSADATAAEDEAPGPEANPPTVSETGARRVYVLRSSKA